MISTIAHLTITELDVLPPEICSEGDSYLNTTKLKPQNIRTYFQAEYLVTKWPRLSHRVCGRGVLNRLHNFFLV